jgi:hypothetical protein
MQNIYKVYSEFEKCFIICHFDEISYWRIKSTGDKLAYYPCTREAKSLLGIVGEEGEDVYARYLQYKENK